MWDPPLVFLLRPWLLSDEGLLSRPTVVACEGRCDKRCWLSGSVASSRQEGLLTLKRKPWKTFLLKEIYTQKHTFGPSFIYLKVKKKKHNLIFFCWHQTNPFKRKIINSYKKLLCSNTEFMYFRDKRSAFQSKRLLLLLQHNSLGSKQL